MLFAEENQPNNKTFHFFSFLYGQLVNCKQFIYFWNVSEFLRDFLLVSNIGFTHRHHA